MGRLIIIAASEIAPFAKTGGLADVLGALPLALQATGHDITLFLPYYREVADKNLPITKTGIEVRVPVGKKNLSVELLKGNLGNLSVYFLKRDEYFDRSQLYGTNDGDYFDNLERFTLFSRGVIEAALALKLKPDVFWAHDWQTGLIPAYLKTIYSKKFPKVAKIFTIHNLAYQGRFSAEEFSVTGLPEELNNAQGLEFWDDINLLKSGVIYSDVITTVSEAYSREIETKEYGCGMEGVLVSRADSLYGILNGVDYALWDPSIDEHIAENYSIKDLKGKASCKKDILKEFGLKVKQSTPLIGIISRLADQKGFDILSKAMGSIMEEDLAMVVLGTGEEKYQELFLNLAKNYPKKLGVKIAFDNATAHKIEAGSDIFLMPSHYEPCGLNQIYSLRYGTVPVVRATGGLDDTIKDYKNGRGCGFKFKGYSALSLTKKLKEALALFKDKKSWKALMLRAMTEDFSWNASAEKYSELFEVAIKKASL